MRFTANAVQLRVLADMVEANTEDPDHQIEIHIYNIDEDIYPQLPEEDRRCIEPNGNEPEMRDEEDIEDTDDMEALIGDATFGVGFPD